MNTSAITGRFGARYWIFSLTAGLGFFFAISFTSRNAKLEPIVNALLWPGAALATVIGFGRDDLQGFFLYILGNMLFYCLVFLLLFRQLKVGWIAGSANTEL